MSATFQVSNPQQPEPSESVLPDIHGDDLDSELHEELDGIITGANPQPTIQTILQSNENVTPIAQLAMEIAVDRDVKAVADIIFEYIQDHDIHLDYRTIFEVARRYGRGTGFLLSFPIPPEQLEEIFLDAVYGADPEEVESILAVLDNPRWLRVALDVAASVPEGIPLIRLLLPHLDDNAAINRVFPTVAANADADTADVVTSLLNHSISPENIETAWIHTASSPTGVPILRLLLPHLESSDVIESTLPGFAANVYRDDPDLLNEIALAHPELRDVIDEWVTYLSSH